MKTLATLGNYTNFLESEDETTKETLSHFKKEFELYERSFNMLSKTVDYLYGLTKKQKLKDSMVRDAVFILLPRIMQSMQSIRVLNLKGYYYDSKILERCLGESIGLCAYFALNEKEAENWIRGRDIKIAKIKLLDYVKVLLNLTVDDEFKSIYGDESRFVHSNVKAIVSSLAAKESVPQSEMGFYFAPTFDREKVCEFAAYPTLMLILLKKIFQNELTKEITVETEKWIAQYLTEKRKMRNMATSRKQA